MSNELSLDQPRRDAAQQAFEDYDFGTKVNDYGEWNTSEPLCLSCIVHGDGLWANFNVRFQRGSAEPTEVYALDMGSGDDVGFLPNKDAE
ncbi:hypothetical protein RYA05_04005 [Pseudomonas syringae pv. actinidiae]|nr:hypothetical protein [Pseudomonas syringae pv. actinidiae]